MLTFDVNDVLVKTPCSLVDLCEIFEEIYCPEDEDSRAYVSPNR
jgi:hypothetical protein